jgi:hypothetical protein
MIISDLNHINVLTEESVAVIGGGRKGRKGKKIELKKELETEIEFEFESEVDIKLDKNVDIKVDVKSDVDIDDNFASLTFDVEAIGDDTLAEADVSVLVIDNELSSVAGVLVAAAD